MESKLLSIIKKSKLDLTNLCMLYDEGYGFCLNNFDLQPIDFLRFSKKDLIELGDRGLINSLTNSKRAIDCQIDEVLFSLGINANELTKSKEFNNFSKLFQIEEDISFKLKIIQILNLAPSLLISKTRNLRNKLEHVYERPSQSEVKEAFEVADLFIKSIHRVFNNLLSDFKLTDEENYAKETIYINFSFNNEKYFFTIELIENKIAIESIKVDSKDKEYFCLLKLMISYYDEVELAEVLKIVLKYIEHPIPSKNIDIIIN
jgi:hypothetical protein